MTYSGATRSDYAKGAPGDFLAQVRREYMLQLPTAWRELFESIITARATREQLPVSIVLAHRLRGNAGAHGCASVGELAGEIEQLLQKIAGGAGVEWTANWSQIMALLHEGTRCIADLVNCSSGISSQTASGSKLMDPLHL